MFIDKEDEVIELVPAGPDHNGLYGLVLKEHAHLVGEGLYGSGVDVDLNGRLLAHDILDHAASKGKKLLGYEDELWAIGCAFWMRGTYGSITAEGIASDAFDLMQKFFNAGKIISMPDSIPEDGLEAINADIRGMIEVYTEDDSLSDYGLDRMTALMEYDPVFAHLDQVTGSDVIKEMVDRIVAHIACGYTAGMNLYGDDSHAFELFELIKNALADNAKRSIFEEEVISSRYMDGGFVYRLKIDYQYLNVELEKDDPEDYWDELMDEENEEELVV